jgi:hypothetical protein
MKGTHMVSHASDTDHFTDRVFSGSRLDRIAFPLGGMGAGMVCMEGTGSFTHLSIHHAPEVAGEAGFFATLSVKGRFLRRLYG